MHTPSYPTYRLPVNENPRSLRSGDELGPYLIGLSQVIDVRALTPLGENAHKEEQ
jgi:hypothetical protein